MSPICPALQSIREDAALWLHQVSPAIRQPGVQTVESKPNPEMVLSLVGPPEGPVLTSSILRFGMLPSVGRARRRGRSDLGGPIIR